ncbi:MAG: MarR family transcriptional regulator [Anaerolineales bacterium]|nr:MarR family transcriptional regulator [Anaerolineales bacterium]MCB0005035.1 MarR family transcriptional regulator [Anaerolineales bacterium]MCB0030338.1 MarR family transcriptional regulator [Anaerolineales bacterium]
MSRTEITNQTMADQLHSAAIHLLRRLRVHDDASGLSARRLSALSVVVFAGPITITALAEAEQVRPPTISRLVKELEWEGLVERVENPADRRVQLLQATPRGEQLLQEGRQRRVAALAADIAALTEAERAALTAAIPILQQLSLPADHPHRQSA